MLKKLLTTLANPITSPTTWGVFTRYATAVIGAVLTVVGILGWLDAAQIATIKQHVPDLLAALGSVMTAAVMIYATITKSSSEKAAEAAKQIDAKLAPSEPVKIETPAGQADIIVPAKVK